MAGAAAGLISSRYRGGGITTNPANGYQNDKETTMEAFVLSIQLYFGGPVLVYRVPSCEAGVRWINAAWKWAERSSVKIDGGPAYVCWRAET